MSYRGDTKWLKLDYAASSMYSVLTDKQFTPTTAGRSAWKSLITGSSLQRNCNREGFDVSCSSFALRIGIASNEQDDCLSCDSFLGFGSSLNSVHCGNYAAGDWVSDNGDMKASTFGYILVQ